MGITAYRANVEIHIFQLAFNSLLVQVGMDFLNFVDIPHVLGDILFAFGFHILNHFRIHLCELIGFTGNGILKIGGGVADFLRVAQMSMSMDGFSFGCGAEKLGNLGFAFLVGFLCVGEIFAVGLGFTGKSSHQMFNSLAHDVSLLKFFEGL